MIKTISNWQPANTIVLSLCSIKYVCVLSLSEAFNKNIEKRYFNYLLGVTKLAGVIEAGHWVILETT